MKSLLLFILVPYLGWSHPNLSKISGNDREILENFFDQLIHFSTIGYSLCGEKPVAIETLPSLAKIPSRYAIRIFFMHPGYSTLWRGINTWQRYSHLFPSTRFTFRFNSKDNTIILINKKSALKVIKENLDLFQRNSKSINKAEYYLEKICNPNGKDDFIGYPDDLLGILLGFGRNNSLAFSQKNYFQKLEGFNLFKAPIGLGAFISPGFLIINNGTNEKENRKVRRLLRGAESNIRASFEKGHYLEKFIQLLTR